ncbi:cell division protein FtsQ/DivIB [Novosphingobium bradum]|uniref:Cell division protein FtsQ n=1 Tax=Novosphingobium bradum TaxID=1737444 RepID=A0ABV7ILW7_9SPHN
MSQTLKRKAPGVARVAAQQGKARKARAARARTGSVLDAVMSWLPFSDEQLHRIFLGLIFAVAIAAAWAVALMAGVPSLARDQFGMVATNAGFALRHVEVRGAARLDKLKVYEIAFAQKGQALPLVDIEQLRADLLQLSWVGDARVSRQFPNTVVVDIVERQPRAVLRKPDRLMLIDDHGTELEPVAPERIGSRLIVSGPGAGQQVEALSTLLEAAPALKPQVREAEWVGNRRWNLTFKTGQVLALPEGDKAAPNALIAFARLDGVNRLLGGKVAAFDMRAPDRIYFRVPGRTEDEARAAAAVAAAKVAAAADRASAEASAAAATGANEDKGQGAGSAPRKAGAGSTGGSSGSHSGHREDT